MDEVMVAAGVAVPLFVALVAAITYLVATCRRERRRRTPTGHLFRGHGEAIMVAELLAEARERGEGIRLNWPTDDRYASPIRPDVLGQFPTVILPRVDSGEEPEER